MFKPSRYSIIIVALTGCSFFQGVDPCSQGSIQQNDPEIAADCEACGHYPCETMETGGDPEDDDLRCRVTGDLVDQFPFCVETDTIWGSLPEAYMVFTGADCVSTAQHVPHVEDWGDTPVNHSGQWNVWCPRTGSPFTYGASDAPWKICKETVGGAHYPAVESATPGSSWTSTASCGIGPLGGTGSLAGTCALSLVAIGGHAVSWMDPHDPQDWTCSCTQDSDCQNGAVCQAGAYFDGDGMLPKYSLCVWDDGTSGNGVAPQGPVVYGLERWEDGIIVDSRTNALEVTAPFVRAAILDAGLWDDDQRFSEAGVVQYCGDDSLCDYLGLGVGDVVSVDPGDAIDFINEMADPLTLYVYPVAGGTVEWSITYATE